MPLPDVELSTRNTSIQKLWQAMRYRGWEAWIEKEPGYMPELRLYFGFGRKRREYIIRTNKKGQQLVIQVGVGPHGIGWREVYKTQGPYSTCIEFFNTLKREVPAL